MPIFTEFKGDDVSDASSAEQYAYSISIHVSFWDQKDHVLGFQMDHSDLCERGVLLR